MLRASDSFRVPFAITIYRFNVNYVFEFRFSSHYSVEERPEGQ
jgi:hypothetical protein